MIELSGVSLKKSWSDLAFKKNGLVLLCVVLPLTYSVLINGVAQGCIVPTRGIRQGDPLSSYLFLLCADDFSSFIYGAVRNKANSGISICKGCLMITHLFFADDSLIFL